IVFSPAISGRPTSMLPNVDFHLFPLANPGLVSIPLSFLLGVIGTYVGGKQPVEEGKFAEMEVRSLTGAGTVQAVAHGPASPTRRSPCPVPGGRRSFTL